MKICLAVGIYSKHFTSYLKTVKDGSCNILLSFYDFQSLSPKKEEFFELCLAKSRFFLLDSGAFSMLYGTRGVKDVNNYVDKYIALIQRYKIENCIELDLYNVIGKSETEQIRAKIEDRLGRQIIPVFHKSLKLDYYEQLTKQYSYIAIGGIAIRGRGGLNVSVFNKLNTIARENNCKTHGLGYTSLANLRYTGFYSVDSTSWISPLRYGHMFHVFKDGVIKPVKSEKGKTNNNNEMIVHQFQQWCKYADYVERI